MKGVERKQLCSDKWEEQYAEFKVHIGIPEHLTQMRNGLKGVNAKIKKRLKRMKGAPCGVIGKLDLLIASRSRMRTRRAHEMATEFSQLHLI